MLGRREYSTIITAGIFFLCDAVSRGLAVTILYGHSTTILAILAAVWIAADIMMQNVFSGDSFHGISDGWSMPAEHQKESSFGQCSYICHTDLDDEIYGIDDQTEGDGSADDNNDDGNDSDGSDVDVELGTTITEITRERGLDGGEEDRDADYANGGGDSDGSDDSEYYPGINTGVCQCIHNPCECIACCSCMTTCSGGIGWIGGVCIDCRDTTDGLDSGELCADLSCGTCCLYAGNIGSTIMSACLGLLISMPLSPYRRDRFRLFALSTVATLVAAVWPYVAAETGTVRLELVVAVAALVGVKALVYVWGVHSIRPSSGAITVRGAAMFALSTSQSKNLQSYGTALSHRQFRSLENTTVVVPAPLPPPTR